MIVCTTISELREWRAQQSCVALVPTMGNLHAGHLALVAEAQQHAETVVVSLFVNPTQFDRAEDLANYPRTLEADKERLAVAGVDCLFAPGTEEIYPQGNVLTTVQVGRLGEILEGAARPEHFTGVATVVNKLFHLVQPQTAVFGEKDYQQLLVIRQMVADLNMPVSIIGLPTVRAEDGLALSSRNGYLTEAERAIAPKLAQVMAAMAQRIEQGECACDALIDEATERLNAAGFKTDCIHIRNAQTLAPASADNASWVILMAAFLGSARLIDNQVVIRTLSP